MIAVSSPSGSSASPHSVNGSGKLGINDPWQWRRTTAQKMFIKSENSRVLFCCVFIVNCGIPGIGRTTEQFINHARRCQGWSGERTLMKWGADFVEARSIIEDTPTCLHSVPALPLHIKRQMSTLENVSIFHGFGEPGEIWYELIDSVFAAGLSKRRERGALQSEGDLRAVNARDSLSLAPMLEQAYVSRETGSHVCSVLCCMCTWPPSQLIRPHTESASEHRNGSSHSHR